MILRESYERYNNQSQTENILKNVYRIHDSLEKAVRELGMRDYYTETPIRVSIVDYMTLFAIRDAETILREIFNSAQWEINHSEVPTLKVSFGEIIQEVTWTISK
jgi:hypothetical protein